MVVIIYNLLLHPEHSHPFISVTFSQNTGRCLQLSARSLENKYKGFFPPSTVIHCVKAHYSQSSCSFIHAIIVTKKNYLVLNVSLTNEGWDAKEKRKKKMEIKKLHQNIKHGRISSQCTHGFLAKNHLKGFHNRNQDQMKVLKILNGHAEQLKTK